ncbi:hypothetical protein BC829DRAFT_405711 [Chytridium lagenaria]|nr:hypothetical protein BC829DRAFT_405711 [Chytridium lagenaria]
MADVSGSNANLAADKLAAAGGGGGGATAGGDKAEEKDLRKNFNYPLVKVCDMVDELRVEAVDMVVTAVEKHPGNYEAAAKSVKELMDKRCGSSWHVVVGRALGNIGILVWKAS